MASDLPLLPLAYLRRIKHSAGGLLGRAAAWSLLCEMGLVTGDDRGESGSDEESEGESDEEEEEEEEAEQWAARNAAAASEWDSYNDSDVDQASCCGNDVDQEVWGGGGEVQVGEPMQLEPAAAARLAVADLLDQQQRIMPAAAARPAAAGLLAQQQGTMRGKVVHDSRQAEDGTRAAQQRQNSYSESQPLGHPPAPSRSGYMRWGRQPSSQRSSRTYSLAFPSPQQVAVPQPLESHAPRSADIHFSTSQPSSGPALSANGPATAAPAYSQGPAQASVYSQEETYVPDDEVVRMLTQVQTAAASQAPLSNSCFRAITITPQRTTTER